MAGGAYSSISDVIGSSISDASAAAGIDAASVGLTDSAFGGIFGGPATASFTPTATETAAAFANPTTYAGISGATPATAGDLTSSGDFSQITSAADLLAGGGAGIGTGANALGGVSPAAQALSATGNPLTPSFSAPAVSSPPPAVTGSAGGAGAGTSGVGGAAAVAPPSGVAIDPASVGGFNQPDVSALGQAGQLLGDTAGNISGAAAGASSPGTTGWVNPSVGSLATAAEAPWTSPSAATFTADTAAPTEPFQMTGAGVLDPGAGVSLPTERFQEDFPAFGSPQGSAAGITPTPAQIAQGSAIASTPTDITPYSVPPQPGSILDQWGDPLGNLQRNLGLGTPDTVTATPSLGAEAAPSGTVTVRDLVTGEGNIPPDTSVAAGGPWATAGASPDLTASPTGGFASPAAQDLTGTLAPTQPADAFSGARPFTSADALSPSMAGTPVPPDQMLVPELPNSPSADAVFAASQGASPVTSAAAVSPSDQIDLRGLDMVTPDTWNAATAEQGATSAVPVASPAAAPVTDAQAISPLSGFSQDRGFNYGSIPASALEPASLAGVTPATPATPIAPTEVVRSESFPVVGASPTAGPIKPDLSADVAPSAEPPLRDASLGGSLPGGTPSGTIAYNAEPGSVPATGGDAAGGPAASAAGGAGAVNPNSPAVAWAAANPPPSGGGGAIVSSDGFTPTVAGSSTLDASLAAGGGGVNYGTASGGGSGGKPWWQSMVAPAGALAGGAAALALSPSSPLSGIFGSSAYPGETQIAQEAQQAQNQSNRLESYITSGTLPPGLEASLNAASADAETAIKSKYASMGMSGSSAEQQDIQSLKQRIVAQQGATALQLFQQGVSEAQLSSQLYTEIMNQAIAQDQALSQSISGIAGALASLAVPLISTGVL